MLVQIVAHEHEQGSSAVQFGAGAATLPAPAAALLGKLGAVALATGIALTFSTDSAFAALQGAGYGTETLLLLQP